MTENTLRQIRFARERVSMTGYSSGSGEGGSGSEPDQHRRGPRQPTITPTSRPAAACAPPPPLKDHTLGFPSSPRSGSGPTGSSGGGLGFGGFGESSTSSGSCTRFRRLHLRRR